jgi:hypothetical protein
MCSGVSGLLNKNWCVQACLGWWTRIDVFRRVWVAEQGLMCSGVSGLLNKDWCVQACLGCWTRINVFRRVWIAEQGLMCSGVSGLLNKDWCVQACLDCWTRIDVFRRVWVAEQDGSKASDGGNGRLTLQVSSPFSRQNGGKSKYRHTTACYHYL